MNYLTNQTQTHQQGFVVYQENLLPSTSYPSKAIAWQVFNNLQDSVKFTFDQKLQVATSGQPESPRIDLEFGKAYLIENGAVKLDQTKTAPPQYIDILGPNIPSPTPLTLYFYRSEKLIGKKEIFTNEIISLLENKIISVAKVSQGVIEGQEFDFFAQPFSQIMLQGITEAGIDYDEYGAHLASYQSAF